VLSWAQSARAALSHAANASYLELAKKWREKSIEEMHHPTVLDRIRFFGGSPNMGSLDPLRIGQSVQEII
jgi:bacterioferritin